MTKIIAVIGATGSQGGGLVRAILADKTGGFAARAITRNPDSDKAKALAANGADVVAADLDDVESLVRAFDGAYGAFCVTNFWEHFSPATEIAHARNLAEAVRRTGLKHVVWSTLEDTREFYDMNDERVPTLQDVYKVPHFDAKGEADAFFRDSGVPTTFMRASFYWENFIHFGQGPQRGADGRLRLVLPMADKSMGGIAAEDIGRCVYGMFKLGPDTVGGDVIGLAGEALTGEEYARVFSEALGEPVDYAPVTTDTYRAFGFPGADDMGNMYQYYQDDEQRLNEIRDVERSRSLNPQLQDFATWARANASQIPVAV
jgi:uncharacterized protein YbjT (DUF2867 family)